MSFRVIIPARYGSSRLPGKPLVRIAGKTLIAHVYACAQSSDATDIVIATDDERIAYVAKSLGATVCMTGSHHQSGSERIAEALKLLNWPDDACIVNLQGDEPCMPPDLINQVANDLQAHPQAVIATLATPLLDRRLIFDPNVVKVVTNADGYALYFSRAPIPWHRDKFNTTESTLDLVAGLRRHIGLYAYRAGFLHKYVNLPVCPLELAESLEQLRVLWHGLHIYVGTAMQVPGPGVDVPADVAKVEALLAKEPHPLAPSP